MSADNDKIKDKIRKLLALANDDGAFEGEIDNALRFARRMMLEHNVTEHDLGTPQDPHEAAAAAEYAEAHVYTAGENLSTWENTLLWAVSTLIGTVNHYKKTTKQVERTSAGTIVFDGKGREQLKTRLVFYGPAEDARDATELFNEWTHVIASMARLKFGGCFRGLGRSYAEGFSSGLLSSVKKIMAEERMEITQAAPTGNALVLVRATDLMQAKKAYAVDWLKKTTGIKLKTSTRRGSRVDGNAYGAGLDDGKKSNFSRSRNLKIGM